MSFPQFMGFETRHLYVAPHHTSLAHAICTNNINSGCYFIPQVAPYTSCLINGIYWAPGIPRLVTIEQCRQLQPSQYTVDMYTGVPKLPQRLLAICDISADPNVSTYHTCMYSMYVQHNMWFEII